jgi:hypothetical protein
MDVTKIAYWNCFNREERVNSTVSIKHSDRQFDNYVPYFG